RRCAWGAPPRPRGLWAYRRGSRCRRTLAGEALRRAPRDRDPEGGPQVRDRPLVRPVAHLALAVIHLPVHFPNPLDAAGMVFGSLFAMEAELTANAWPAAAVDAVESFQVAVTDAKRLRLPLVVDS